MTIPAWIIVLGLADRPLLANELSETRYGFVTSVVVLLVARYLFSEKALAIAGSFLRCFLRTLSEPPLPFWWILEERGLLAAAWLTSD